MFGVAFSGGGIRSAAFCSGVLRRLLQHNVEPDYLSCVSGGGYTGTAYLDWKRRKGGGSDKKWQNEFFEHMRSRAGYLCNWPWCGICDTFIILLLMLFVSVLIPVVGWGSFACPLAFVVDWCFGKLLRAPRLRCNETSEVDCEFPVESNAHDRMLIFVITLGLFISLHLVMYCCNTCKCATKWKGLLSMLNIVKVLAGVMFASTFLPWVIHDYLDKTPYWVQYGIVVSSAVVWFFLPVLRLYSSLVILVYTFSYVIYWRVYKEILLTVQYEDKLFRYLLIASCVVLGMASTFGEFQLRLVHIYNRWRLQKAFYTKESVGCSGCAGIGCYDCFPGLHLPGCTYPPNPGNALTLSDLMDVKPQYISNIVINGWRESSESKRKHCLLTMSPTEIEVLGKQLQHTPQDLEPRNPTAISHEAVPLVKLPRNQDNHSTYVHVFEGKLRPEDIKLSEAMAMSAAALSPHLGAFEQEEQALTYILTILGLEMAASMVYNISGERAENCCRKILPYLIKAGFIVLIVFSILYIYGFDDSYFVFRIGIGLLGTITVIVMCFAVQNTGDSNTKCSSKFTRWLLVHVPFYRFVRMIFDAINTGPVPPAMLHLSDGGHYENLAILPLFERRLEKIIVVDGGYKEDDSCYADDLVQALQMAREKLECSFTDMHGEDVLADIKYKFGKKRGPWPRKYEFKVHYYRTNDSKREHIKEGHVVLITPRHPNTGHKIENEEPKPWKSVLPEGADLEPDLWGTGPVLDSAEVDRLTCCCCECCHGNCCCKSCCGVFPNHNTSNQFFTRAMFSAYHREGYRACMEGVTDDFFGQQQQQEDKAVQVELLL